MRETVSSITLLVQFSLYFFIMKIIIFSYFEADATQEILDELLPTLFPWSASPQMLSTLMAFLPVGLPPKYAKQGHELWFEQLMTFWDTCHNVPGGMSVSSTYNY